MRVLFLFFVCIISISNVVAQSFVYSSANAHSHNDYAQQQPFVQAYNEQFGSIEADIHLRNGKLLVGHDSVGLTENRSLEKLYLIPMAERIKMNKGLIYSNSSLKLQLLIDIKTDPIKTLDILITLLKNYPSIINNPSIKIVISGNKPDENLFNTYPTFIWFDGRLDKNYTTTILTKIALLSNDFNNYSLVKKTGVITVEEEQKIASQVSKAHTLHKPIRFWASPDNEKTWQLLTSLHTDYINTDKIGALSDFLLKQKKLSVLMPYNRIICSAGEVIRFGKPNLENHALDIIELPNENKVIVEDRYGLLAIDLSSKKIIDRFSLSDNNRYRRFMSTYSGITSFKENGKTFILWSVAEREAAGSALLIAEWANGFKNVIDIPFEKKAPASNAIPNEIAIHKEGTEWFIYIVLNGNNELVKIRWADKSIVWRRATGVAPYGIAIANQKIYITNWAGPIASDSTRERAGVPWGLAYTDPTTGATAEGTVMVFEPSSGKQIKEIMVGLHPNSLKASKDESKLFVANGSSDLISVINTKTNTVIETIDVGLINGKRGFQGSTPNGLELNVNNSILYVANGLDNALAVVRLGKSASTIGKGKSEVIGYIPTEAYPAGVKLVNNHLVVANLESDGANVIDSTRKARSIHHQLGSVSIIPVPDKIRLTQYTQEVAQMNLVNRSELLVARKNISPVPIPERLGEPSVFKHVVYIIKENKTYDQVFGDLPKGNGDPSLCIFGERITPNIHALAKQFGWMDNYYASGKSSAEGHQWTDGAMVSDYVEKNVRAWFRSYPHRQEDALVYNKSGFIWNHALDHGKTVRIYGEACETEYDKKLKWADLYKKYMAGEKPNWYNESTIARILPIISPTFPDCDNIAFSDQQRADIFIEEWKKYELGDSLPNLMIVSLPNDHSAGTSPDFPTPNAMVADNDLAVGRIMEMISKSKYWDSTVVFITQDDSQSGWDHVSAYRTIGLVASAYSNGKVTSTNYNQTSMLKTIEQILGLPPMNIIDATARPMTDCFTNIKTNLQYSVLPNNIPLNEMNKSLSSLKGEAKKFALQSQKEVFNEVDGGKDDTMNRIIWFYAKGNAPYPSVKR